MTHLLEDMTVESHLSLEPLLHLAAIMARDLQGDYMTLLPKFIDRVRGRGVRWAILISYRSHGGVTPRAPDA